jgi:hypothetical protein
MDEDFVPITTDGGSTAILAVHGFVYRGVNLLSLVTYPEPTIFLLNADVHRRRRLCHHGP